MNDPFPLVCYLCGMFCGWYLTRVAWKMERAMSELLRSIEDARLNSKPQRTTMSEFNPDWVSHPSETAWDVFKEKRSHPSSYIAYFGGTRRHRQQLMAFLAGAGPVTPEIAQWLVFHCGGSAEFWLERQRQYDESLRRIRRPFWFFVHNAVAHPLLSLAILFPPIRWVDRFHDYTGRKL